ncbi:MAG: inosine monophosphate cyclohydrolase [Ruminococcaceae bacterium]|nr:inosine monophosphate cyclohydrolase [Oscillospiraceae bacterium]
MSQNATYATLSLAERLSPNPYPGRGIVLGKTPNGRFAAFAYFIMGRSDNSRNRVFTKEEDGTIRTEPYDVSRVKDPSLIIYAPVRAYANHVVVTNGDQTDTAIEGLKSGLSFSESLKSREFEPDAPNLTPRISGVFHFENGAFTYEMSILKSADPEGSACNRFTYDYAPIAGLGHFIHTYMGA